MQVAGAVNSGGGFAGAVSGREAVGAKQDVNEHSSPPARETAPNKQNGTSSATTGSPPVKWSRSSSASSAEGGVTARSSSETTGTSGSASASTSVEASAKRRPRAPHERQTESSAVLHWRLPREDLISGKSSQPGPERRHNDMT
jgi:hypothetical protein